MGHTDPTGIYGAWGLVITAIFIHFIVDKLGRRPPLIYGAFAMAICLAWQAAIGAQFKKGAGNYSMGLAGVASFFCFSWAFSWSYGPVSWVSSCITLSHLMVEACFAVLPGRSYSGRGTLTTSRRISRRYSRCTCGLMGVQHLRQ